MWRHMVTVPPWPPGKPHLVPGSPSSQPNVVTIRWDPPPDDGGAPITGNHGYILLFISLLLLLDLISAVTLIT
jgi:hypothetical protein